MRRSPLDPGPALAGRLLAGLLLAGLLAAPASAKVFRWVDSSGTPHFSDRAEDVPPEYRDQLEGEGAAPRKGSGRFVIVPGINGEQGEEGKPPAKFDEAAFQAEAMAALTDPEGAGDASGPPLPDLDEILDAGAPMIAGLLAGVVVGLGLFVLIGALILGLACRICGEERPPLPKAAGIVLLQSLASFALGLIFGIFLLGGGASLQAQSAQFGLGVLVQAGVLRGMLIESFGKSLAVTAVALVIQVAVTLLLALGFLGVGLILG